MNFNQALERWIRANLWGLPPRRSPKSPQDPRGQEDPAGGGFGGVVVPDQPIGPQFGHFGRITPNQNRWEGFSVKPVWSWYLYLSDSFTERQDQMTVPFRNLKKGPMEPAGLSDLMKQIAVRDIYNSASYSAEPAFEPIPYDQIRVVKASEIAWAQSRSKPWARGQRIPAGSIPVVIGYIPHGGIKGAKYENTWAGFWCSDYRSKVPFADTVEKSALYCSEYMLQRQVKIRAVEGAWQIHFKYYLALYGWNKYEHYTGGKTGEAAAGLYGEMYDYTKSIYDEL